jgi:hypothetical protein
MLKALLLVLSVTCVAAHETSSDVQVLTDSNFEHLTQASTGEQFLVCRFGLATRLTCAKRHQVRQRATGW